MIVELAAVRLLAPWFGTSLVVWTNVIAVVLLALAAGYWIGARLAAGPAPLVRLGWILVAAGPLTAWIPALSAPLASLFLPETVALHEAGALVLWGSLACSLLLFLPPAMLLGTVSPLAVESIARGEQKSAGDAGGRVLCFGTVGSLAGVFATSHLLVPGLGLVGTFLVAAGLLVLAGVLALGIARSLHSGRMALPAALFFLALILGGLGSGPYARAGGPPAREGWSVLFRGESPYQSVRVVEAQPPSPEGPNVPEAGFRYLQVNEGFDSYQSVWQPEPGLLPQGFYYNDFALPCHWARSEDPRRSSWSVLVLGLGAGTAVRVVEGAAPADLALSFTGIELDPMVVGAAREHLELVVDGTHRVVSDLDARVALRGLEQRFDQIVLDCYANQVEIPPHLCTVEFFVELREHLVDGGYLAANLGGFGFDDPLVRTVARTAAHAFGEPALLTAVPASRNYTLFLRRDGALPLDGTGRLAPVGEAVAGLLRPRTLPGLVVEISPDEPGELLTDDRAPVELLQKRSIDEARERRARAGGGL